MKNLPLILSSLALAGVLILLGLRLNDGKSTTRRAPSTPRTAQGTPTAESRIAVINIDSLDAKYDYLKTKRQGFLQRQSALEAEFSQTERSLQSRAASLQKRAQEGALSQADGEKEQASLMKAAQDLESRRQSVSAQLVREQDAFNKDLKDRLDAWISGYNSDGRYDFVFSYAAGGPILYAAPAVDITGDAIEGMNKDWGAAAKPPARDTTKN